MASKSPRKPRQAKSSKSPKGQGKKTKGEKPRAKPSTKPRKKKEPVHLFKPGHAPHPSAGRPPGSYNLKDLYNWALAAETIELNVPGMTKPLIIRGKQRMVMARVYRALAGDQRAMDAIENRIEGMPIQAIKNVGDATGKVSIIINRVAPKPETVEVKTERTEPTDIEKPK